MVEEFSVICCCSFICSLEEQLTKYRRRNICPADSSKIVGYAAVNCLIRSRCYLKGWRLWKMCKECGEQMLLKFSIVYLMSLNFTTDGSRMSIEIIDPCPLLTIIFFASMIIFQSIFQVGFRSSTNTVEKRTPDTLFVLLLKVSGLGTLPGEPSNNMSTRLLSHLYLL